VKNKRILIVDDDLDLLSLLDWHLNRSGYKTGAAVNGLEAIMKIREFKPDLLLLDIMLPEIDGLKLCRWIKDNKDVAISNLCVVLMTALSGLSDRARGLSDGADYYITKPFDMNDLVLRIEALLHFPGNTYSG